MKGLGRVVVGSIGGGLLGAATFFALEGLSPTPANSQLAEEGINDLGNKYKIFIYAKESRGQGKWDFQTKTVGEGISKPRYSSWQIAGTPLSIANSLEQSRSDPVVEGVVSTTLEY